MAHVVDCPACGKKVPWAPESRWRPFCSERCKLVDLGDWAAERHVIGGTPNEQMSDDGDGTPGRPPSQRSN